MGEPNKRVDIFFSAEEDSDGIGGDVESHCINFRHLYNDDDVTKLCNALSKFFKSGNFVNPFVPGNAENSNVIKITEAQLKQVIVQEIHKILY